MSCAAILMLPAIVCVAAVALIGGGLRQLAREERERERALDAALRRPDLREGAPHA